MIIQSISIIINLFVFWYGQRCIGLEPDRPVLTQQFHFHSSVILDNVLYLHAMWITISISRVILRVRDNASKAASIVLDTQTLNTQPPQRQQ